MNDLTQNRPKILSVFFICLFITACADDNIRYGLAGSHPGSVDIATIQSTPPNEIFTAERSENFRGWLRISLLRVGIDSGLSMQEFERFVERNSLSCTREIDTVNCERTLNSRLACCSGSRIYRNVRIGIVFKFRGNRWFLEQATGVFL